MKVLVAHEPGRRKSILAATDLTSDGFPVLEQAARLGLALETSLTALHNVDPLMVADRAAARLARGAAAALAGVRSQVRLADAVQSLPVATTQSCGSKSILSSPSWKRHGCRTSTWWSWVFTNARVSSASFMAAPRLASFNKSQRSVLVTPIS